MNRISRNSYHHNMAAHIKFCQNGTINAQIVVRELILNLQIGNKYGITEPNFMEPYINMNHQVAYATSLMHL